VVSLGSVERLEQGLNRYRIVGGGSKTKSRKCLKQVFMEQVQLDSGGGSDLDQRLGENRKVERGHFPSGRIARRVHIRGGSQWAIGAFKLLLGDKQKDLEGRGDIPTRRLGKESSRSDRDGAQKKRKKAFRPGGLLSSA